MGHEIGHQLPVSTWLLWSTNLTWSFGLLSPASSRPHGGLIIKGARPEASVTRHAHSARWLH